MDTIPVWLSHEIAHAVRYASPDTDSPIPRLTDGTDCWLFWDLVETLPLAERFLDEGLATAFSRAVAKEATDEEILGMTPAAVAWLEEHGESLLHQRLTDWDFARCEPPLKWRQDTLWYDPARVEPPFSVQYPPTRWGYYAGERFFVRVSPAHWAQRLMQLAEPL